MTFDLGSASSQSSALDSQTDRLMKRVQVTQTASPGTGNKEDAKIEKAGKDFESILLGTWLQQAENSFAKVPGGDDEDDQDPGKDQFQGIAMQALAGSLTKSGGIGIAKMITDHLRSSSNAQKAEQPANPAVAAPLQGTGKDKKFLVI